jgi:hypothetical protein
MKHKKIHNINNPGFKIPVNYLESLEDRVFDRLKGEEALENIEAPGYKTPPSYFDSLEARVITRLNEGIELDQIQESGFKAPDGYFKTVEKNVEKALNKDEVVKVVPLFSRRNIMYATGIAAMIMIMLGIFLDKGDTININSLDIELVETYLEQQDLDTYDIASLLNDEDLVQEDLGIIDDDFSEELLEDYLIDNADLEDIIEQ